MVNQNLKKEDFFENSHQIELESIVNYLVEIEYRTKTHDQFFMFD